MGRTKRATSDGPVPEGNFTLRGSWDPTAHRTVTVLYEFVMSLCQRRRLEPSLSPADFVDEINASGFATAFPNVPRGTWDVRNWLEAPASTSAERAVVAAGRRLIDGPVGPAPSIAEVRAFLSGTGLEVPF